MKGINWELEFGADEEFSDTAETLAGEPVIVTGVLEIRKGVEVRGATSSVLQVCRPFRRNMHGTRPE